MTYLSVLFAVASLVIGSLPMTAHGMTLRVLKPAEPASNTDAWPNIGFNDYHGKLGDKVVALTFDDGPDGQSSLNNHTRKILDVLKDHNIAATFFVCGNLHTSVVDDVQAQQDIRRMVAEGHDLGSHSHTHARMVQLQPRQVEEEWRRNADVYKQVLGANFAFTKFRIPYGQPYQTNQMATSWMAQATLDGGVHVGWGIDTDDWKCAQNGQEVACILNNLRAQLDHGHSGPILMHSVYELTARALGDVISMLQQRGYTFVTVEQMIADKYNMSSAAVMAKHRREGYTPDAVGTAARRACAANQDIVVPY